MNPTKNSSNSVVKSTLSDDVNLSFNNEDFSKFSDGEITEDEHEDWVNGILSWERGDIIEEKPDLNPKPVSHKSYLEGVNHNGIILQWESENKFDGRFTRKFMFLKKKEWLPQFIASYPDKDKTLFEGIQKDQLRKGYFDIDFHLEKYPNMTSEKADQYVNILCDSAIYCFKELYKFDITKENISIYSSCGKVKFSYHVIIDRFAFADHDEVKHFYDKTDLVFQEACAKKGLEKVKIDDSVYKSFQLFRLPGNQKRDSGRFLIPYNEAAKKAGEMGGVLTFVDGCKTLPKLVPKKVKEDTTSYVNDQSVDEFIKSINCSIDKIDGNFLKLKNNGGYKCPCCNANGGEVKIHTSENPFIVMNEHGYYFDCRRRETGVKKVCIKRFEKKATITAEFEDEPVVEKKPVLSKEEELLKDKYKLLTGGDVGMAELLKITLKDVVVTDMAGSTVYIFDKKEKVWEKRTPAFTHRAIGETLVRCCKDVKKDLAVKIKAEEDGEKKKILGAELTRYCGIEKELGYTRTLNNVYKQFFIRSYDPKFVDKLDNSRDPKIKNKHMLPLRNRVNIDLKTGQLVERKREDYFTHFIDLDMDTCPEKLKVVEKFMWVLRTGPDQKVLYEVCRWLLGSGLSGYRYQKYFPIFFGALGNNGKSTINKLMKLLLQGFFRTLDPEIIVDVKNPSSFMQHYDHIRGKRYCVFNELKAGQGLNVASLKNLTGGGDNDPIAFTKKHSNEEFSVINDSVISISTNKLPVIPLEEDQLVGKNGRMKIIPCDVVFKREEDFDKSLDRSALPEDDERKYEVIEDKKLVSRMEDPNDLLPSFLYWLVLGCVDWYKNDCVITFPSVCDKFMSDMKKEQDTVQQFCDDCIDHSESVPNTCRLKRPLLYPLYEKYVGKEKPATKAEFLKRVEVILGKATPMKIDGHTALGWEKMRIV